LRPGVTGTQQRLAQHGDLKAIRHLPGQQVRLIERPLKIPRPVQRHGQNALRKLVAFFPDRRQQFPAQQLPAGQVAAELEAADHLVHRKTVKQGGNGGVPRWGMCHARPAAASGAERKGQAAMPARRPGSRQLQFAGGAEIITAARQAAHDTMSRQQPVDKAAWPSEC